MALSLLDKTGIVGSGEQRSMISVNGLTSISSFLKIDDSRGISSTQSYREARPAANFFLRRQGVTEDLAICGSLVRRGTEAMRDSV